MVYKWSFAFTIRSLEDSGRRLKMVVAMSISDQSKTFLRPNLSSFYGVFAMSLCRLSISPKDFQKVKNMLQKCYIYIFSEIEHITILLLIRDANMSWSTTFVSLNKCLEFPIFDTVSLSIKCTFWFNKKDGLCIFKTLQFFSS